MSKEIQKLMEWSISRLEAVYNEASRRENSDAMALIKLVCGFRKIEIKGRKGNFEFIQK